MDLCLAYSLIYPQEVTVYQVHGENPVLGELRSNAKNHLPEHIKDLFTFDLLGPTTNHTAFTTFLDSVDGSYCDYSAYGIDGDSPGINTQPSWILRRIEEFFLKYGTRISGIGPYRWPWYTDANSMRGPNSQRECGTYNLTRVLSVSYRTIEIDLPKAYVERQCNEYM